MAESAESPLDNYLPKIGNIITNMLLLISTSFQIGCTYILCLLCLCIYMHIDYDTLLVIIIHNILVLFS